MDITLSQTNSGHIFACNFPRSKNIFFRVLAITILFYFSFPPYPALPNPHTTHREDEYYKASYYIAFFCLLIPPSLRKNILLARFYLNSSVNFISLIEKLRTLKCKT